MTKLAALLATALSLLAATAAPASAAGSASTVSAQNALEAPVLAELNRVRADHGLEPLTASLPLAKAADAHAASMGRLGYFSHTSANGTTFDKRIARFYPASNFSLWKVGENLLWSSGELTPAQAVALWMASPGHRRNILDPAWRKIGISAVRATAAGGEFGGRDVTLLVTDFGVRA